MGEEAARTALAAIGLDSGMPLTPRHGWANEAWVGTTHVVRISSGRLRSSLAHEAGVVEAMAAARVPVARVAGRGDLDDGSGGEWLVSERMPGDTLAVAWPGLTAATRKAIGEQLGSLLQAIHRVRLDAAPAWWLDAHRDELLLHNGYHPRPELGPRLVAAVGELPAAAVNEAVLDTVAGLIADRLPLFAADDVVFAHTDVHMHNVLVDGGRVTAILDWEGAHPAAPDVELDMLLRFCAAAHAFPERPGAAVHIAEGDGIALVDHVAAAYPALFDRPHLRERLEAYDAHWHLVQLLVTDRLHGPTSEAGGHRDPGWDRLRLLLDGRSHLEQFRHLF